MRFKLITLSLLASTALCPIALAQSANPAVKPKPIAGQSAPAPVVAAPVSQGSRSGLTAAPTDFGIVQVGGPGGPEVTPNGVNRTDFGGGNLILEDTPKARSTVTRDAIAKLSPTVNPYQAIQLLPGANVSSTDAFGLNGGNITVRGFNSDQIGVTVEGAPVNDSGSYSIFPQEYTDSNNFSQVSLAQGTPDLDSPHIGATGGVLNIYMRDPAKTFGGYLSQSLGSHGGTYSFARIETGQIGNFRGFASYSHYERNHWNGVGTDKRDHVDVKGVYDFDASNRVSFSAIYNDATNTNYFQVSKANYAAKTNLKPLVSLPGTFFTGADQSLNGASNYQGYRINPFRNLIASAPSTFNPLPNLTYDVIPYFWYGFGNGGGVSTLANGAQFFGTTRLTDNFNTRAGVTRTLYYNPSITETYRPGIINKLTYQFGDHKLLAGYWFEYANHKQTAPYTALNADGSVQDAFATSNLLTIKNGPLAGQVYQRRDQTTVTTTNVFFIGDQWSGLNDRLNIDVGIKQAFVTRDVTNRIPGTQGKLTLSDAQTLPQAGIRYKFTPEQTVFASVGTTFRTPANFTLVDVVSQSTGRITTKGNSSQNSETAVTGEIGHRYQGDLIATSVSVFGTQYANRQVSTSIIDGGSTITSSINAGSVTSWGVDAEVGTRPIWGGLRAYVSGELLFTRLNSNLQTTNTLGQIDYLPTKGKQLPRAPKAQAAFGLDYDDGHIFGNLSAKFVGSQYATFTNDEAMRGFSTVNAAIGYRFDNVGVLKRPELKLNLHNIFDRRTLTGVSGVQTNAQATTSVNGKTIASGGSPTYYQGEGFAAILTFATGF